MHTDLPIYSIHKSLCDAWVPGARIVLGAPPGAGKSTQVPRILLSTQAIPPGKKLVVLEPRRLATRLVAARVAEEMGEPLGQTVGYQIRFERVASERTRILFVTEGVLVRMMLDDSALSGVAGIIFDEFHERHLASDLSLAWAKRIQASHRPDLVLLVMSATLDTQPLTRYLEPVHALEVYGRAFPVSVQYCPGKTNAPVWEIAAQAWAQQVASSARGDCLIFMPSVHAIDRTLQAIRTYPESRKWTSYALHAQLPHNLQQEALAPQAQRKVIVSTNVAETSVTIDGVHWVIDSGLARIERYDPRRDVSVLLIDKISQSSAAQRAGRAGRVAPGSAIRLWTEQDHTYRVQHEAPEIARVDLSEIVLSLKAGSLAPESLDWLDAPAQASLDRAYRLLCDLGALETHSLALTPVGKKMAAFPMHPRYARMLIAAGTFGCVGTLCRIAALAQLGSPLLGLRSKATKPLRAEWLDDDFESDFFRELHGWDLLRKSDNAALFAEEHGLDLNIIRQAERLTKDFERVASAQGLSLTVHNDSPEAWAQCILMGLKDRLAKRLDSGTLRCALVYNRRAELSRSSVVQKATFLVAADLEEVEIRGDVAVRLGQATAIDPRWLELYFPEDFRANSEVLYDTEQRRVIERSVRSFRDLIIENHESQNPSAELAACILSEEVLAGRLLLKQWDDSVDRWIMRVNLLAQAMPSLGITPIDAGEDRKLIVEQLCSGALSYKEIKDRPLWPVLKAWLSDEQLVALDYYAPESITLPNRKRPASIRYEVARAILSATVQDLYDAEPTRLFIAAGTIPLVIEVLAPNRRPVQLTQDLKSFWKNSYPQIKKDLKGRYPKHEWR